MKISELIAALNELQQKHGDVFVFAGDGCSRILLWPKLTEAKTSNGSTIAIFE